MADKFYVTGEQELQIDRIMCDIKRQLRVKSGSPLNPELVIEGLKKINDPSGVPHITGKNLPSIDPRFELLMEFKVTFPTDYDHGTQLSTLKPGEFRDGLNRNITDRNFRKATQKLVPGKTYKAKFFSIRKTVTSDDCLGLYKAVGAILAGAQGMSLVSQLKRDVLPKGKCTVSFDKKDALWKDSDGDHRVPYVVRYSDGDYGFDLGLFGLDWGSDFCLLCFCDGE